ncbi:MAG TPA: arginase family protein [Streptosporangiaceae bacterium]|jgi:arginase
MTAPGADVAPAREVTVVGVPANSAGTADGVARGPAVLRERGLAAVLASGPRRTDGGDVVVALPARPQRGPSGLLAEDELVATIGQVRAKVAAVRSAGSFPILIGGDCPLLLGAVAALQDEDAAAGLLFVDGHEDAWPPLVSLTGEAADCELGLALRLFDAGLDARLRAALPRLRSEAVVVAGPRDAAEIAAAGVSTLAGRLRALIRPAELSTAAFAAAAASLPWPFWLHVDLDVLATTELAAVDYPQPGGLTWGQLTAITAVGLGLAGCAGLSVCIYNPDLDGDGRGAAAVVAYLAQAIALMTA